jgi:hypothetical protein
MTSLPLLGTTSNDPALLALLDCQTQDVHAHNLLAIQLLSRVSGSDKTIIACVNDF